MRIGDRVVTGSGRSGTMIDPPWGMPHHALIRFDDGAVWWVVRSALSPAPSIPAAAAAGGKRRRLPTGAGGIEKLN